MPDGREGWQRCTIMIGARDHAHHHLLATELIGRARRAGLAGATLLEAVDPAEVGVGRLHHLFRDGTRLSLLLVDEQGALARFLGDQSELLRGAIVVLDDVTAFRA